MIAVQERVRAQLAEQQQAESSEPSLLDSDDTDLDSEAESAPDDMHYKLSDFGKAFKVCLQETSYHFDHS